MLSLRAFTGIAAPSSSLQQRPSAHVLACCCLKSGSSAGGAATLGFSYGCSLSIENVEPERDSAIRLMQQQQRRQFEKKDYVSMEEEEPEEEAEEDDDEEDEEEEGIGGSVQVPRPKHIAVSKTELLDAIVTHLITDSPPDHVLQFRRLSSCLDSLLHAEHKEILEEMRNDYFTACCMDNEEMSNKESDRFSGKAAVKSKLFTDFINGTESTTEGESQPELENAVDFTNGLDLRNFFSLQVREVLKFSGDQDRLAQAARFQRAFMQLLHNAQFEELSARDLMLTSSLNTDYLLTLPIYVDWKKASDSNAIIFRRGYATERQKGLLIVEKLDYLQSKFLQRIFFVISKPLGKFGAWVEKKLKNAPQTQEIRDGMRRMKPWVEDLSFIPQSSSNNEQSVDSSLGIDELSDLDLPIWVAAQRAVSRYEGFLSAAGPRGRLLKKFLTWTGLISSASETPYEVDGDNNTAEPYARPIFLSRMSLSDIWRPASRKSCGNDLWKMFKTSVSILLSKSILQEPAFQELILLYTEGVGGNKDKIGIPSLQLKIYERIPIPELPVIFPHKKLSFRIIDTVRLDVATIVGLLAYFINYKFEDILSSPSAIVLDVIAITALIIFVTRVALGYKQTWDRYQLLVNKALYEKTLASGFGSVHFLLDASEQQQFKEAILAYAVLLKEENNEVASRQSVGDKCEKFMFDVFREKVEMPVDKAICTLLRLGLATETRTGGRTKLQAVPCLKGYEALKSRWNSLLI